MKTRKLAVISIFGALIIILQLIASNINISGFPITLTLIPIITAADIYGEGVGGLMGLVFGVIVTIMVINGTDVGGAAMFSQHPIITVGICLSKGFLCGYVAGLVFKALKDKNQRLALILSSICAPIVNTFILYLGLILFFDSSFKVMIGAFISINFVIELLINGLLSPGLLGLINRYTKRK